MVSAWAFGFGFILSVISVFLYLREILPLRYKIGPISIFFLFLVFIPLVSSIYLVVHGLGSNDTIVPLTLKGISNFSYVSASFIYFICVLTFLVGFKMNSHGSPHISRFLAVDLSASRSFIVAFTLGIIGVVAFYLYVSEFGGIGEALISKKRFLLLGEEGEYSVSGGILGQLTSLLFFSVILLSTIWCWRRNKASGRFAFWAGILFGVVFLINSIFESSRSEILILLLAIFSVLESKNTFQSQKLLIWLVVGISLFSIGGSMRGSEFKAIHLDNFVWNFVDQIGSRAASGWTLLSLIIEKYLDPSDAYWGETYIRWIYGFVPREHWPDKPAISMGQELKVIFLGRSSIGGGGVPPTSIDELFLNFSYFAFLTAPFFFLVAGRVCAIFYWSYYKSRNFSFSVFSYALIVTSFIPMIFINQFSQQMLIAIKTVVTIFLIRWMCGVKRTI